MPKNNRDKAMEAARAAIWMCNKLSALEVARALEVLPDECLTQLIAAAEAQVEAKPNG